MNTLERQKAFACAALTGLLARDWDADQAMRRAWVIADRMEQEYAERLAKAQKAEIARIQASIPRTVA